MSVISLERRLRKIEATRFQTDPAVRALSDAELAAALRAASPDPGDHALADWFATDCEGDLPFGAVETILRSL